MEVVACRVTKATAQCTWNPGVGLLEQSPALRAVVHSAAASNPVELAGWGVDFR